MNNYFIYVSLRIPGITLRKYYALTKNDDTKQKQNNLQRKKRTGEGRKARQKKEKTQLKKEKKNK